MSGGSVGGERPRSRDGPILRALDQPPHPPDCLSRSARPPVVFASVSRRSWTLRRLKATELATTRRDGKGTWEPSFLQESTSLTSSTTRRCLTGNRRLHGRDGGYGR